MASDNLEKPPWYRREKCKFATLLVISIVIFVAVYAIIKREMKNSPILYMTTHNYSNIIAFDGRDGDLLGESLLDMSALENISDDDGIRFRGMMYDNGHLLVINAHHKYSFIAKYICCNLIEKNNNSQSYQKCLMHEKNETKGIPFDSMLIEYDEETNWGFVHPYKMAYHHGFGYYFVSTQDTHSVLAFNKYGKPLSLPGMSLTYPGAVITILHSSPGATTRKETHSISRHTSGVRGLCIDESMNLLFIASEFTHNIIVLNIKQHFRNVYNITLPNIDHNANIKYKKMSAIDVIVGMPYFNNTLFISDKGNKKIFAYKIYENKYQFWWESQYTPYLSHPTGLAISNQVIYVLSKSKNRILLFSPHTGQYLDTLVHFRYNNQRTIIENMNNKDKNTQNWHVSGEQMLYVQNGGCTANLD